MNSTKKSFKKRFISNIELFQLLVSLNEVPFKILQSRFLIFMLIVTKPLMGSSDLMGLLALWPGLACRNHQPMRKESMLLCVKHYVHRIQ